MMLERIRFKRDHRVERSRSRGTALIAVSALVVVLGIVTVPSSIDAAEVRDAEIQLLPNGLYELRSEHLKLTTDVPIDDELKRWPIYIEQAMEQWLPFFGRTEVPKAWSVHVVLMADKPRFVREGYLEGVPGFEDGFQKGNQLFVIEQPSAYYRRHLFLHEATHWIMSELFGGGGSYWYMEGMAELFGTHRWDGSRLTLGWIPDRAEDVPYWGRLRVIHESLQQGIAPSLNEILSFTPEDSSSRAVRYAWSWAAAVFFMHHPDLKPIALKLTGQGLDYSSRFSKELKAQLEDRWPTVLNDWNGFISDLDFSYYPERSLVRTATASERLMGRPREVTIDAARGWQTTGILVNAGETIRVTASGQFVVASQRDGKAPLEWISESQGLTLRYQNRYPIGKLIGTVVPQKPGESTTRWATFGLGASGSLTAPTSGTLFLKLNEFAGDLADNRGTIQVQVEEKTGE